jgi:hypothetical protein
MGMHMSNENEIEVFGRVDSEDRAGFEKLRDFYFGVGKVDADTLAKRLKSFLQQVDSIVQQFQPTVGDFSLEEVSVSVEVSASGHVSLLGAGGETGATGGLVFKLKRQAAPQR